MQKDVYAYELYGNLYLNLTNACCNDCSFCIRRGGDGITGNRLLLRHVPTAEEVIQQIDLVEFSYFEAVFCGYGEPTYELDTLLQVAKYLKSKGKRVRLNTNGLGNQIHNKDIVPLLANVLDEVSISLNESDGEKYQAVCHSVFNNAYQHILDFTQKCVAASIKTVLSVVDVIGEDGIARCKERAKQLGAELRVRQYIANNERYE